jgi:hypothetical protein
VPSWEAVFKRWADLPNITAIIDIILTLSPSSSEAERGFSQLKLVKTKLRSTMSERALNETLAIKLLSRGIDDFDPLPAIDLWNSSGQRPRRATFQGFAAPEATDDAVPSTSSAPSTATRPASATTEPMDEDQEEEGDEDLEDCGSDFDEGRIVIELDD